MAQIPITGVPSTYRVPGQYAEILFAQGPSTAAAPAREVIFVMPTLSSGGTWTAGTVYRVRNEQEAINGAGVGSPLHRAIRKFLRSNTSAKVWALPYAPSSGGAPVKAALTVTWTNAATAVGITSLWVAGDRIDVAIKSGDSVTTIATNAKNAVNARPWLPCVATNVAGVLTLTAQIAGASQNAHIRVRASIDAGITTTVATQNASDVDSLGSGAATAGVDGTTTEATNFTNALANIASSRYYYIVTSLPDATNLGTLKTHLATKSNPIPGLRSVGIAASVASLSASITIATGRNYERLAITWQPNSEHTLEELAGNSAAVRHLREQLDSAFNFDFYAEPDWQIQGCYRDADRPSGDDLNDAILGGLTPIQTTGSGGSYIVMSVNTRSKDSTGNNNDFRAAETHRISVADEYTDLVLLRHALQYKNKKLKEDELTSAGTVNHNQRLYRNVVTPSTYRPFIFSLIDEMGGSKFQDIDGMKATLRVVIDNNNRGRLEVGHDIKVIDLLHQMTLRIAETTPG
jgi:phage tail sheath gpL-like